LDYLITPSTRNYMISILRAISSSYLPVLLEGATSVGKTSIIKYIS